MLMKTLEGLARVVLGGIAIAVVVAVSLAPGYVWLALDPRMSGEHPADLAFAFWFGCLGLFSLGAAAYIIGQEFFK